MKLYDVYSTWESELHGFRLGHTDFRYHVRSAHKVVSIIKNLPTTKARVSVTVKRYSWFIEQTESVKIVLQEEEITKIMMDRHVFLNTLLDIWKDKP